MASVTVGEQAKTGGNLVALVSASGGVGLSVVCAMLAFELSQVGLQCALVDADFDAGGLDMLLGMENDKGLRFGSLNAPLGGIDGDVLERRLPHCEGVPVLSFDSWTAGRPEWWEVTACLEALGRRMDVVVVDGARGQSMDAVPMLADAARVVVAELSVLGLARTKTLLSRYRRSPGSNGHDGQVLAILGVEPRGSSHRRGVVSLEEASAYLGREVLGPVPMDAGLTGDILEGLGIHDVGKATRRALRPVVNRIREFGGGGR